MDPIRITIVLFLGIFSSLFVTVPASSEEKRLIAAVLNNSDPSVRPVLHPTDPVNITLGLSIEHIIDLSSVHEKIVMKMQYALVWYAPTLTWDPSQHGNVTSFNVQPERLWTPDLEVQVSTRKDKRKSSTEGLLANTPIIVLWNGSVVWHTLTITEAACHVDPTYFPFDRHLCYLNFSLWSYPVSEATLSPIQEPSVFLHDQDHGIWTASVLPMMKKEITDTVDGETSDQLIVRIFLERAPLFYVYNIIYPGVTLMTITLIGFFIPHTGGKITYGISIMVTVMMFQQYLMKVTTRTSLSIPILAQCFGTGLVLALLSLVSAVTTVRVLLYPTTAPESRPNDRFLKLLSRMTGMQKRVAAMLDGLKTAKQVRTEGSESEGGNEMPTYVFENRRYQEARCVPRRARNRDDSCGKKPRAPSLIRDQPKRPLEVIAADVLALKKRFLSDLAAEEAEGKYKDSWEILADMIQRLAFIISTIVLVCAFLGIFLQLPFRPPLY